MHNYCMSSSLDVYCTDISLQAKGLCEGQVVVGINGKILNTSEKKHADSIIAECARKSSPVSLLIERGSS